MVISMGDEHGKQGGQAEVDMDQELKLREQLSALADGQLADEEWVQTMRYASEETGRGAWLEYHLIGEVLRSPELPGANTSKAFLADLHARMAQEPGLRRPVAVPAQPVEMPYRGEAANQALLRWKMIAGVASFAAVSALGWGVLDATRASSAGAQMAAAPAANIQVVAQPTAEAQVMLRDPRLDELLAARRQYGGANALQMPARFLRNSTLEDPQR